MKKSLLLVLSMVFLLTFTMTAFASGIPFADVPQSAWYYSDVESAYTDGLINGKSETVFAPDDNLTYAEAVKLAACMHMVSTIGEASFEAREPWYQIYVDYARRNKIIDEDYNYVWDAPATRAGYMAIFANAISENASRDVKPLAVINGVEDGQIPDVPMTHPQADAIYKLYRAGILQGNDDKLSCDPDSNIKRSEVAAILTRMMKADKRIVFNAIAPEAEATPAPGATATPKPANSSSDNSSNSGSSNNGGFSGNTKPKATPTPAPGSTPEPTPTPKPTPAPGNTSDGSLKIIEQPVDIEAGTVEEVMYTVKIEGGVSPYTYTWESSVNGESWSVCDVTKTIDTISEYLPEVYGDGEYWRCKIEDAAGNVIESDAASYIEPKYVGDLEIILQPQVQTCYDGQDVKYSVVVRGGTAPYTFVWEVEVGEYPSIMLEETLEEGTSFYTDRAVSYADQAIVRCTITDADGNMVVTDGVIADVIPR